MITLMTISEIKPVMELWKMSIQEQFDGILSQELIPGENEVKEIYETSNIYLYKDESNVVLAYLSIVEGGYVENIYVVPNARRKSIGTQLVKHVQNKYDELVSDIIVDNLTGISFFQSVNFIDEGTSLNDSIAKKEVAFYWSN